VLELPDLAHIDPAPVFTDLDLVMGTDFDLIAPFLKGVDGTGTEHPFPDPFALIGPHGDADLSLPVIDDFQQPTGFIAIVFWWPGAQLRGEWRPPLRQLYLHLGQSEQRGEEQEHSHKTAPANVSRCHTPSILAWGKTEATSWEYTAFLPVSTPQSTGM